MNSNDKAPEPVTDMNRLAVRLAIAVHLGASNSVLTHGGVNQEQAVDNAFRVADMFIAKSGL